MTQFNRLKEFINHVGIGNTFTTKELQEKVGKYENKTSCKRITDNPYFTTYLYRAQLRNMGCLSKIKRGLWKVEHNIPVWFGSFHFKGLHGGYSLDNKYADHNCFYWNNLPAEQKVNPFKQANPNYKNIADDLIHVEAAIKLCSMPHVNPAWCGADVSVTVKGVVANVDSTTRVLCSTPTYQIGGTEVDEKGFKAFLHIITEPGHVEAVLSNILNLVIAVSYEKVPVETPKTPSIPQIDPMQIMREYLVSLELGESIRRSISNISADEVVDLELGWNNQISISFDERSLAVSIADDLEDDLIKGFEDFYKKHIGA